MRIENFVYKDRITSLAAEVANLRTQIELKDKIIKLLEYCEKKNINS